MTDDTRVTDQETRAWMEALSDADKQELKRRALERRAVDLSQPEKPEDPATMSSQQFEEYKMREFAKTEKRNRGEG